MTGRDDGGFLRPFAQTGGRVKVRRAELEDLTTEVQANPDPPARNRHAVLTPEARMILHMAQQPRALAELVARMPDPLRAVQFAVEDLVDDGHLTIIPTLHIGSADSLAIEQRLWLMEKVKIGLQKLV